MGLTTSKGRAEQESQGASFDPATIQHSPFAAAAGVQGPCSCTSSPLSQCTSSCSCLSGRSSEEVVALPLSDMLQQGLQMLMQLTHTTLNCRVAALLDADMVNVASHGLVSQQQITAFNSLMSWTMCQQHRSSLNLQRGEHASSCPAGGSDSTQDLATPPLPTLLHGSWRDASANPQQRRVADKLKLASFWACRLQGDGVLCLAFGSPSSKMSPHQQGVLVQAANLAALQLQLQQQQHRSSHQFQTLRRRHRDLHRNSKAAEVALVAADEVFRDELSHNLRTPLSAVRACSQLLLEGKGPDRLSPGPANLVGMIDAAGHELQLQLMKALEKTLRASSTKVRDRTVPERAPPPPRRHSLDGRLVGGRGSLSPVAEHSALLGGKQRSAALASVPQCLTTSEALLRLCRPRSLPGNEPLAKKRGPPAAQAGGRPEWAPAQAGNSHWRLLVCTEGSPSKKRNLEDMARQDSDQLTMAAGRQDSCKVPTAPHVGRPASSTYFSMRDSRSETSAEASDRSSRDVQAALPVTDAPAEAQGRQEAGRAQQTHGQVMEVVPGSRRSQSLKEPLGSASHDQPQDKLAPSSSLPASLGQAAAPGSLHQHLSDSARRAAAACQALSCSTSNGPVRQGCRGPAACGPLPRTSPPGAAASASQAQPLSSPCAGAAGDRHTSLESVAAMVCSERLPCSSRASDDEARPGCRAAAARQACQCGRACAGHVQDVRGGTSLDSVVGMPATGSASIEAMDCCRAASACFSPPSRDLCGSSPPQPVAEESANSMAPANLAASAGQSESGTPSGKPLQATAAASAARCSSDGRGSDALHSSEALRVLVAEDNVVNRKVLVRLLAHIGFHADAVGDGLEALQAVQQTCYDVLLLDLRMPRMNGVEAATHIAHEVPPQRQPRWIFALTADMLSTVEGPCRDAGMSGYMEKPYDASKLRNVLTKLQQEAHSNSCTSERHWVGRL